MGLLAGSNGIGGRVGRKVPSSRYSSLPSCLRRRLCRCTLDGFYIPQFFAAASCLSTDPACLIQQYIGTRSRSGGALRDRESSPRSGPQPWNFANAIPSFEVEYGYVINLALVRTQPIVRVIPFWCLAIHAALVDPKYIAFTRGTCSLLHVGDVILYVWSYVWCQFNPEPNGTSDLILTPQILHSIIAELGKLEGRCRALRRNTAPVDFAPG